MNVSTRRARLARGVTAAVLAAAATSGLAIAASTSAHATITVESTTTATKCAGLTYNTPTDWYFPSGTPTGLVWLQHGFTEDKSNYAGFANELAGQGDLVIATTLPSADLFGCTVSDLGNNVPYLNNVADLFGKKDTAGSALQNSFTTAKNAAGRSSLTMPTNMVFVGHSAGAEVVSYVADRLKTTYPTQFGELKGVVLEDGVNSFIGSTMTNALKDLNSTSLEIYGTASPSYSCNSSQSGTILLENDITHQTFWGAQITTGAHPDVFGSNASGIETLTCGTPQAQNTAAVRGLSEGWIGGFFAGADNPSYFPGGTYYNSLVSAGTISTLP